MDKEIEMYKKKLKTLEMILRELKYYRKALERDVCKFFIKSYSNEELDCNMYLIPGGRKDIKQSDYQHYIYKNKSIMVNILLDSINGKSGIPSKIIRDLVRYKNIKKSIREVSRSIKANTELYNKLMKEYKTYKNKLKNK